jgi:recombination protein RecA
MPSNRQRKLDAVVARLQLQYGPKAVRKAAPPAEPITRLATTFAELDGALGGGLPAGRITEIIGAATSGKATLAAKVLATAHAGRNASSPGSGQGLVAWFDLPRTSDPDYLHRCGVDLSRLLVVRPRDGADALAITLHLVESDAPSTGSGRGLAALIFDATAQSGDSVSPDPATLAGSLERLATLVTQTQTAVIFLTGPRGYSRTLAHVATVRLALRHEHWIIRGDDVRGYEAQVEIVKHRLGQAGAVIPLRIVFNGTVRGAGL